MKRTIRGVEKLAREAVKAEGLEAEVENARWLSRGWCRPRTGEGPEFKVARVELVSPSGGRVMKLVTVETDGSWSIR